MLCKDIFKLISSSLNNHSKLCLKLTCRDISECIVIDGPIDVYEFAQDTHTEQMFIAFEDRIWKYDFRYQLCHAMRHHKIEMIKLITERLKLEITIVADIISEGLLECQDKIDIDKVKWLLGLNCEVIHIDYHHRAIETRDHDLFNYLQSYHHGNHNLEALTFAIDMGDMKIYDAVSKDLPGIDVVSCLLDSCRDVSVFEWIKKNYKDYKKIKGRAGSVECLQWLIKEGIDLDPKIVKFAIEKRNDDILLWLIQNGYDINIKHLGHAINNDNAYAAKIILSSGEKYSSRVFPNCCVDMLDVVEPINIKQVFSYACENNEIDKIRKCLDISPKLTMEEEMVSSINIGNEHVFKLFLERGYEITEEHFLLAIRSSFLNANIVKMFFQAGVVPSYFSHIDPQSPDFITVVRGTDCLHNNLLYGGLSVLRWLRNKNESLINRAWEKYIDNIRIVRWLVNNKYDVLGNIMSRGTKIEKFLLSRGFVLGRPDLNDPVQIGRLKKICPDVCLYVICRVINSTPFSQN